MAASAEEVLVEGELLIVEVDVAEEEEVLQDCLEQVPSRSLAVQLAVCDTYEDKNESLGPTKGRLKTVRLFIS